ncbi:MAG TPA: M48 family metalloprotease [Usitatibacter sp.]|nr:M48 family metalloprotease [Usitatibacter sp.]
MTAVPASSVAALAWQGVSDRFWLADQLAAPALALLLLASGFGSRLCAAISRLAGHRRYVVIAAFAATFVILLQLLRAPLGWFWVRALDRATGSPATSLGAWMPGELMESLLLIAGCVAAALALYALMARGPRSWWLLAAIPACGLVLLVLAAQPWTRAYAPLGTSAIDREIGAIASRAGVPAGRIGIQHSDERTGCGAATVIGLGPTRVMLLDDTLVEQYPPAEIVESVAHESSHFIHDDNVKAFAMISAWLFFALGLVRWVGGQAVSRWHGRFGFDDLANPASLPLVVSILVVAYLVALPFGRAYQRTMVERRADRFALDLTHDNASEAMLYVKDMKCYPLLVSSPSPFYRAFRATHPSIEERIRFADAYHPWKSQSKPR